MTLSAGGRGSAYQLSLNPSIQHPFIQPAHIASTSIPRLQPELRSLLHISRQGSTTRAIAWRPYSDLYSFFVPTSTYLVLIPYTRKSALQVT